MNEAMYYKKPLIMTDTGGAADVIEDSDIGILIENEYGDTVDLHAEYLDNMAYNQREYKIAEQLSVAILEFASNKEYWKDAGKKGRKKIIDHYNFDSVVNQYQEVFMELLDKRVELAGKK